MPCRVTRIEASSQIGASQPAAAIVLRQVRKKEALKLRIFDGKAALRMRHDKRFHFAILFTITRAS